MAGVRFELEVNLIIIIDFYLNYSILRENSKLGGLVTDASEKGTPVRLFHPPVGGKLIRGFEGLGVGDRVRVELITG